MQFLFLDIKVIILVGEECVVIPDRVKSVMFDDIHVKGFKVMNCI